MITEAETKEIEKEAELVDFSNHAPDAHEVEFMRIGYIAGATRMAEKNNLEIEWLKKETKQFERMHDNLLSINESLQAELERVKAVAEKMAEALIKHPSLITSSKQELQSIADHLNQSTPKE